MPVLLDLDARIRAALTAYHTPWLDPLMWALTVAGVLGLIWICIAGVMAAWAPRLRPAAWQVVVAVVLAQVVVDGVLKPAFARARPFTTSDTVRVIAYRSTTHSFPSGHATSSFAAATVLAFAVRRRWPAFTLATLVAFSRIYVGVHYPLDVVSGALLGTGLGVLVTGGRAWYSRGSSNAPTAVPR